MPHPEISTTSFNAYYVGHQLSEGDMGETNLVSETWIVERKVEGGSPIQGTVRFVEEDFRLAINEGAMPYTGQRYVDWYPNTKLWMQFSTLVKKELQFVSNGKVQATYTWFAPFHVSTKWWEQATPPGPSTPVDIAYDISVDYSTSFRTTERLRQKHSSSALTNPDPTWANGLSPSDIGGYAILPGRQGMPYNLVQRRIRVRRTLDFKYIPQSQLQTIFNGYVNTYNSHAFMAGTVPMSNPAGGADLSVSLAGYPVGTVLFESLNVVKTTGQYGELVADMVHEPYWHFFDQIAVNDPDGEPQTEVPTTGPWAGTIQLKDVRWIRQPRDTKNHNDIFFDQNTYNGTSWTPSASAGYLKLAQAGWWTK
jgi:hypothetical protein